MAENPPPVPEPVSSPVTNPVAEAQALASAASGPVSEASAVEAAMKQSEAMSTEEVNKLLSSRSPDDPELRSAILKRDYTITFPSKPELFIKIENITPLSKERFDEKGEPLKPYFGMITKKDQVNDIRLANVLKHIHEAGVHTHSYSAKSGTNYRVTRIFFSESRLRKFADGIDFIRAFDKDKIKEACEALNPPLQLTNPSPSDQPEVHSWYDPYENLCGPYNMQFDHLYKPMEPGEKMKVARLLITGDSHLEDDAKGCGLDIAEMEEEGQKEEGFCLGFFPIHQEAQKKALEELWMPLKLDKLFNDFKNYEILPNHQIMEYFGEEIGFYFAFLGHLVYSLIPLVPISLALASWQFAEFDYLRREDAKSDDCDDDIKPVMFSSAWAALIFTIAYSLILNKWKCDQSALSHLWHCYGTTDAVPPRPGFNGKIMKNPVTGRIEVDFPKAQRRKLVIRTLAVSVSMVLLLTGVIGLIFFYRYTISQRNASDDDGCNNDGTDDGDDEESSFDAESLVPPILNAVQIMGFAVIYGKVAEFLTEFENHKTILEFNSALFRKLTFCYFVSNFAAPFYIAFIKKGMEGCKDYSSYDNCGLELTIIVAFAFVGNDFGGRMSTSLVIPRLMAKLKEWEAKNDQTVDYENMGPVEKQYRLLSPYDPTRELIMDYIELYVQWGYLTLFGASCPLVVVFALITNLVETRTDGIKLFNDYRRVLPNRVDGIGEPLRIFYITLYIAVPTNCALCVYTFGADTQLGLDNQGSVWLLLFLLICMVVMQGLLGTIYPAVPSKTAVQLQRQDFVYRRVVLGEMEEDDDLPDEFKDPKALGQLASSLRRNSVGANFSHTNKTADGAAAMDIMKITLDNDAA